MLNEKLKNVIRAGDGKISLHRVSLLASLTEKTLTAKSRKRLPDSAFADPKTRSYPIHDKKHVLAAIAYAKKYRDEKAQRAWPKIKAAAKKYGIDAGEL